MEGLIWAAQALLAAVFVVTGATKLTQPRRRLAAAGMGWAADVSDGQFRAVGLLEVLGAAGLILPTALGIAPVLTVLAAAGLALMMVFAAATHVRLHELDRVAVPIVLFVLAVAVAVLRLASLGL
jgi:hypothetical protein